MLDWNTICQYNKISTHSKVCAFLSAHITSFTKYFLAIIFNWNQLIGFVNLCIFDDLSLYLKCTEWSRPLVKYENYI